MAVRSACTSGEAAGSIDTVVLPEEFVNIRSADGVAANPGPGSGSKLSMAAVAFGPAVLFTRIERTSALAADTCQKNHLPVGAGAHLRGHRCFVGGNGYGQIGPAP
ncbi:MAG TPA: hypothetical protein VM223_18920 [Planctomycetota bacterium]|nr:hypothetical protein [Planctomycetota bacterium]